MADSKGSAREAVGWLTGDRQVEAEGRVQKEQGRVPEGEELEEAEVAVKEEHGDFGVEGGPADEGDTPDR